LGDVLLLRMKALVGWCCFWVPYVALGLGVFPNRASARTSRPVSAGEVARALALNASVTLVCALVLDAVAHGQPEAPPWPSSIVMRWILSLLLAEFCFYYSHRLLHLPWWYSRFHWKHHLFVRPYALAAVFCSPVEMLLCNVLAAAAGPYAFGMGTAEFGLWVLGGVGTSLASHSGAAWFDGAHDLHHRVPTCNYSFMSLADVLHGTYAVASPAAARAARSDSACAELKDCPSVAARPRQ